MWQSETYTSDAMLGTSKRRLPDVSSLQFINNLLLAPLLLLRLRYYWLFDHLPHGSCESASEFCLVWIVEVVVVSIVRSVSVVVLRNLAWLLQSFILVSSRFCGFLLGWLSLRKLEGFLALWAEVVRVFVYPLL